MTNVESNFLLDNLEVSLINEFTTIPDSTSLNDASTIYLSTIPFITIINSSTLTTTITPITTTTITITTPTTTITTSTTTITSSTTTITTPSTTITTSTTTTPTKTPTTISIVPVYSCDFDSYDEKIICNGTLINDGSSTALFKVTQYTFIQEMPYIQITDWTSIC